MRRILLSLALAATICLVPAVSAQALKLPARWHLHHALSRAQHAPPHSRARHDARRYVRVWRRRLERPSGGSPAANRRLGRWLAARRGWAGGQWSCLRVLWDRESGWRQWARNGYSGAFGIPQALPASKLYSAGRRIRTAYVQIKWGLRYIAGVYGSPCGAWQRWLARSPHWY